MTFQQLNHLQIICEEGSISKAARRLYTTQPALSRQLKMLEHEMGIVIFERTTPLKLTPEGERCIRFVRKTLDEYQRLKKELDLMARQATGHLTIGISRNRVEQFLPYVLPEFRRRYPGIQITLKEDSANDLEKMLVSHEIDMTCMMQKTEHPGICFEPMMLEEISLAVPAVFLPPQTMQTGMLSLCQLEQVPFILMKPGYRIREISDRILKQAGMMPELVMETSSTIMAYKMAAEGMGVTFVSTMTTIIAQTIEKPCLYSLTPEKYTWLLGCACYKDNPNRKNIDLFMECVRNALCKPPFTELSSEKQLLILP